MFEAALGKISVNDKIMIENLKFFCFNFHVKDVVGVELTAY